ncbi:MAG: tRNA uracil 4-sulfurtransferase ThiI [Treponemataceae bacterium]|nr:tRNA 4-thiouridine(8) synthase ThiI [Spirochaetales bacterium]MDY6030383.1 tRNA uracil 4-sulfurtransferase ThiI [Treponemataceae bacterium]
MEYTNIYLAKVGELTLKGGNIKDFERRLVQNVQLYLESIKSRVTLRAGRMYVECNKEGCPAVEFTLSHLIGITGWAKARISEKNIESIKKACMEEAKIAVQKGCKSFKIESRRSEKSFPLNSYEISCEAAQDIFDSGMMKVDVHNPDVIINVEVREKCFVYSNTEKGCRGLPVGSSNRGLLLLSGGIDSPVAGYRMMRRGMKIDCCYFHAYPYTSEEAKQKVIDLGKQIGKYGIETNINIIPFTEVQMRIKKLASEIPMADEHYSTESYSTLLLRMCMMKCANLVARRIRANCIITGESLGQVASQTLENMSVTESCAELPLLRPLVGMDKEEITETSKFIGTYETSILPYEDCCVLFSPKHPVLKAPLGTAQKLYEELKVDELIQKAFEEREIVKFLVRDYVEENFSE